MDNPIHASFRFCSIIERVQKVNKNTKLINRFYFSDISVNDM